jgi:hypothetical protein
VAPNPDRELAEARAAIDGGDARAALKRLDRARRGYVKLQDTDGLEHLLLLTDLVDATDERTRIGRVNLDYAIKQNLRQESRRKAIGAGWAWTDPYPGLQAPTEHTGIAFTRGVKAAIAIGTVLGAAGLVAFFVLPVVFSSSTTRVTLRLLNDTPAKASVSGCDDPSCVSTWMHADLDPQLSTERNVATDDLLDVFRFERAGQDLCLPLRIHDAFVRHGSDTSVVLVGHLSRATRCPGKTVLPGAAAQTGL